MPADFLLRLGELTRALANSHFVRNVAVVGGGIAIGQAITLAFTPFLTRLYGPEAFGTAASFTAMVAIILPLATLGYASAIVMPEQEEEAGAVARLSILCGLIIGLGSLLLVHFSQPWLADWAGFSHARWVLYFIPLALVTSAFLTLANQAAIRQGLYKAKAEAYVYSTLLTNLGKLAGGLLAPSGLLLIALTVFGNALNLLLQLCRVRRRGSLRVRSWFGFRGVKTAARVHVDFARYRMPQSVLRAAILSVPTLLLASLFSREAAGQYSLAIIVLGAPVGLLGQAVAEVFLPKITRSIGAKSLESPRLLLNTTAGLAVFIFPFATLAIWGDEIVPALFGADWLRAGEYVQWMTLWLFCTLVSYPAVSTFPALRLQRLQLWLEVAYLALSAVAMYVGFIGFQSDLAAVALFSSVGALTNLTLVYAAHRRLFRYAREWMSPRSPDAE